MHRNKTFKKSKNNVPEEHGFPLCKKSPMANPKIESFDSIESFNCFFCFY